jgi:hypothetical protein
MRKTRTLIPLAVVLAAVTASPAVAAARQFEGSVVSVNRDNRTFKLDDAERGTVRIKVNRSTDFERVAFRTLHAGQRAIEVIAHRANGRWVADSVEKSGGGGNHGGDD